MTERTLVLLKPDAVRRGLIGELIKRFESNGLKISEMRMLQIDEEMAERHYEEHRDKPFFGDLVSFITSGPVVAMVIEGEEVIAKTRTLMGATDPQQADPGTIRGDLAEIITENLVHGSDSEASAKRELGLFFPSL